jgi:hypothetical protein
MHPHTFYSSLFDWKRRDEVFVIIPFTSDFDPRWRDVIQPSIEQDLKLKAVRVDERESGESVIHDILDGLAHARLIIADISSKPLWAKPGTETHRSGNVMWELGIAHVMRVPDEVIIVKSDDGNAIFDLTQFRAFQYDPRDAVEARRVLTKLARDRLRSTAQIAESHVRRAAGALGHDAIQLLGEAFHAHASKGFIAATAKDASLLRTQAISRLLELGLLRGRLSAVPPAPGDAVQYWAGARYDLTEFGRAVFTYMLHELIEGDEARTFTGAPDRRP